VTPARVVQISVSPGGVPKLRVPVTRISRSGVEGDRQRATEHHGGPERAVCLYANERITALRQEGHTIVPGAIGENVTIEGLDWDLVVPGAQIVIADGVTLEIARYTSPCRNIRSVFADGDDSRVSQQRHPGWSRVYARVLAEGRIREGDPVRLSS
jgi:MOSC domain-containing protein YiiM